VKDAKPRALALIAGAALSGVAVGQLREAAARQATRDVELDESVRQANLVLARKGALKELHQVVTAKLELNLRCAVAAHLQATNPGQLGLLEESVIEERLSVHPDGNTALPENMRGVIYAWDDVQIMWVGPVTITDEGQQMAANQPVVHYCPDAARMVQEQEGAQAANDT
jgi:hypothetical protein